MKIIAFLTVILALAAGSCATKSTTVRDRDWTSFIANYSYEQAVSELGHPSVTGEQSEGSRFAEWILGRSPQVSFGIGVGTGSYGRHSSVGVGAGTTVTQPPSGEYLRLDFGTNGLLKAWTKIRH